jgi:5S rRNA maturation endonuclease (ribonuclease M5)
MDFLSLFTVIFCQLPQDLHDDVIILNSLSMLDKTINWIKETEYYTTIKLYLDNDTEGRKAVNKIMFSLDNINILDMSNEYKGKKDLNEKITNF